MSGEDSLFISGTDLDRGNTTVHVYDRGKPLDEDSDYWYHSLCGQSIGKETSERTFRANKSEVDCGRCRQILQG